MKKQNKKPIARFSNWRYFMKINKVTHNSGKFVMSGSRNTSAIKTFFTYGMWLGLGLGLLTLIILAVFANHPNLKMLKLPKHKHRVVNMKAYTNTSSNPLVVQKANSDRSSKILEFSISTYPLTQLPQISGDLKVSYCKLNGTFRDVLKTDSEYLVKANTRPNQSILLHLPYTHTYLVKDKINYVIQTTIAIKHLTYYEEQTYYELHLREVIL